MNARELRRKMEAAEQAAKDRVDRQHAKFLAQHPDARKYEGSPLTNAYQRGDYLLEEVLMLRGMLVDAMLELENLDLKLERAQRKSKSEDDPYALPGILTRYADYLLDKEMLVHASGAVVNEALAWRWAQEQGYLPDDQPPKLDNERTVGPIADRGNPYEAGVPY